MSEVKWIKIVTNVFDDEKIRFIETMPNGDTNIVIWFKLLCLCGRCNSGGYLMFTDKLAYTDEMLASIFNRDIKVVQMALKTFETLDMVELIDNRIYISNWEKHQTLDKLEAKKLYDREYQRKKREEKKLLLENRTTNRTMSNDNRTLDKDIEEDIDIDINNIIDIAPASIESTTKKSKKPVKHKHGEYNNVLLTDEEFEKLKQDYSNYLDLITYLDEYIEMKGYQAKSHYLCIRKWVASAVERNKFSQSTKVERSLPEWYKNEEDDDSKYYKAEDAYEQYEYHTLTGNIEQAKRFAIEYQKYADETVEDRQNRVREFERLVNEL